METGGERRHFERDVPTHAEPVLAHELKEGRVYFSVQFVDEDLLAPLVETLVFTGRGFDEDGLKVLYFQDISSYQLRIERDSPEAERATFYEQHEKDLKHIFEYDRALDRLIDCSMRRQKRNR